MFWEKKFFNKGRKFSVIRKLRNEKKITEEFEVMLSNLTLEELIAIKLETSSRKIGKGLFGIPIMNLVQDIVRDALFKFALSAARSNSEAASILGTTKRNFEIHLQRHQTKSFFNQSE